MNTTERLLNGRCPKCGRQMTNVHIIDPLREVCIACGKASAALDGEDNNSCSSTIQYREWLRGLVWSREPIIPKGDT